MVLAVCVSICGLPVLGNLPAAGMFPARIYLSWLDLLPRLAPGPFCQMVHNARFCGAQVEVTVRGRETLPVGIGEVNLRRKSARCGQISEHREATGPATHPASTSSLRLPQRLRASV